MLASYQVYETGRQVAECRNLHAQFAELFARDGHRGASRSGTLATKSLCWGAVTWAQFAAALGSDTLKVMDGLSPPRFQLLDELTEEQLQRLQNAVQPI